MQMSAWNKSPQPHKDEIIYEFKYSFPKGWFYRVERLMIKLVFWVGCLFALLMLQYQIESTLNFITSNLIMLQNIEILDYIILACLCFIIYIIPCLLLFLFICACINILFLCPYHSITLTHKGVYIKYAPLFFPYYQYKFYAYGNFSFHSYFGGKIFWAVRVCDDISKNYKFFDFKHSHTIPFLEYVGMQYEQEIIRILREKTQEALKKQGKAEIYNVNDRIKNIQKG